MTDIPSILLFSLLIALRKFPLSSLSPIGVSACGVEDFDVPSINHTRSFIWGTPTVTQGGAALVRSSGRVARRSCELEVIRMVASVAGIVVATEVGDL